MEILSEQIREIDASEDTTHVIVKAIA